MPPKSGNIWQFLFLTYYKKKKTFEKQKNNKTLFKKSNFCKLEKNYNFFQ